MASEVGARRAARTSIPRSQDFRDRMSKAMKARWERWRLEQIDAGLPR